MVNVAKINAIAPSKGIMKNLDGNLILVGEIDGNTSLARIARHHLAENEFEAVIANADSNSASLYFQEYCMGNPIESIGIFSFNPSRLVEFSHTGLLIPEESFIDYRSKFREDNDFQNYLNPLLKNRVWRNV